MTKQAPIIADARIFLARASSGRSRPLRIIAELPDGRQLDVYLKAPGLRDGMTECHLASEWMGARYARAACLSVAKPCLVRMGPEFLGSFPPDMHQLRDTLAQGPEIAFGSQVIGRGYSMWSIASRPRPLADLEMMQRIYAFDTLIENSDRCHNSPNLMKSGSDMVVFDHEEAFARCHRSYNQAYPAAKPWQVGGVWGHYDGGGQHIFAPYLKRKATTQLDWRDTMHHFLLVPPRDLFQYAAEIPAEWAPATGRSIAEYLCEGMERLHTMATFISGGLVKK